LNFCSDFKFVWILNFCSDLEKINLFRFIKKKKKEKVLMGRPVWKLPACGARFRAAEGGGEERPHQAHNAEVK
jgi:hypothetical protein